MLGRIVSVLFVLALPASALGQSALPAPCREAAGAPSLEELEKRKEKLEREVAKQRPAGGTATAKALGKAQKELLQLIFQIECAQARQASAEPPNITRRPRAVRGRKTDKAEAIEVTTYYATNRARRESTDPGERYGSKLASSLQYGRAVVTIPATHTPGNIETHSFWKLEREPDPSKHFVLKSVDPLHPDKARREIAERLQGSQSKALLLFVHGYYVTFREAALRTAQLAYDLEFQGVPAFYTWPSAGELFGYLQDAETARLSEGAFGQLLEDLSNLPVGDIYIIAHSMGNRIVGEALKARMERGRPTAHLRELLLAAPDINAELFGSTIAPQLKAMQGTRTTIYASSSDLALRASRIVHGFQRVGDTEGGVLTYDGLETVDASSASLVTRAFGHSYIMDTPKVLKDIRALVERGISAKERGLSEVGTSPNRHWKLQ